jgi:hypothetical protein
MSEVPDDFVQDNPGILSREEEWELIQRIEEWKESDARLLNLIRDAFDAGYECCIQDEIQEKRGVGFERTPPYYEEWLEINAGRIEGWMLGG